MSDGSLALTLLRAAVSLVFVLGLLVLCLRILGRRSGMAPVGRARTVPLDLLARRQLSRSASVQVVKVGSAVLVLGVTEQHVRVLTRLSPADVEGEDDDGPATKEDTPAPISTRTRVLDALRRQNSAAETITGPVDGTSRTRGRGRHRGGADLPNAPQTARRDT